MNTTATDDFEIFQSLFLLNLCKTADYMIMLHRQYFA